MNFELDGCIRIGGLIVVLIQIAVIGQTWKIIDINFSAICHDGFRIVDRTGAIIIQPECTTGRLLQADFGHRRILNIHIREVCSDEGEIGIFIHHDNTVAVGGR